MKITKIIEYPGFENLKNNLELYKQEFLKENILIFRNANLTYEEQEKVQKLFGTILNCYPNKDSDKPDPYIEDHKTIMKNRTAQENEILLEWHIEHPYYDNPIVAGFWNMTVYNITNNGGKTLFINVSNLYKSLAIEDQEFLNKCIITHSPEHIPSYVMSDLKAQGIEQVNSPIISKH
jgi:alpha-ketoglutarate-dependent taurine dioxygenase